MRNRDAWAYAVAVASLMTWGCSSTADDSSADQNVAGNAGAGAAGMGVTGNGAAGSGGVTTTTPGQGCTLPLSRYCGDAAKPSVPPICPTSPEAAASDCSSFHTTTRAASSCGGVAITISYGLGEGIWYFDAQGTLVGYALTGDTGDMCNDGGATTFYGKHCERTEPEVDVCSEGGAGSGGESGAGGAGGAGH